MEIKFKIPGEPKGKARPRVTFNGDKAVAYTPSGTVSYENLVKMSYYQQCKDFKFPENAQIKCDLGIYCAIPKSTSKKKREMMLSGEIKPTKKPDIDNIIKAVLDSLNGIAYHDDSQVVYIAAFKKYSEFPAVVVELYA